MSETKNDIAWERIFKKYRILEKIKKNGAFEITSGQINEFREARLMTKFDHRKNLPKIFEENNLSTLPITRGSYLIAQFKAYHRLEEKETEIIKGTVQGISYRYCIPLHKSDGYNYKKGDRALLHMPKGRGIRACVF